MQAINEYAKHFLTRTSLRIYKRIQNNEHAPF